jgi:hypothetical protein
MGKCGPTLRLPLVQPELTTQKQIEDVMIKNELMPFLGNGIKK